MSSKERLPTEQPQKIQLMTIGESTVGKTSLILRYTENKFITDHTVTIGVDFKIKNITIDKKPVKVQIWDTAGQEKFYAITKAYFAKAQGILVVFDVSKEDSFTKTQHWFDSIHKSANENIAIILVGNKCDMERAISKERAEAFANENSVKYFETSCLDGQGVNEAFDYLATTTFHQNPVSEPEEPVPVKRDGNCSC
ncbi:hypothetical protein M9Y10_001461 [Tritrichomonas musculus]|uniref:Small GTP-binding protein n=1 Tax=Tritrichomonas musculus TaxID=1915356 RepID=A0ABR2L725_9EUKA